MRRGKQDVENEIDIEKELEEYRMKKVDIEHRRQQAEQAKELVNHFNLTLYF